jgi:2-(1,2-epoxy-1,2-dihydrophenyl)acetyl-CoA isomerase
LTDDQAGYGGRCGCGEARLSAAAGPRRNQANHRTSWSRSLDEELELQRDEMRRLGFTQDYREGVAAFLEKRPAKFIGR